MEMNRIKEQIIDILSKEFQTLWLIKIEDLSMEVFITDSQKSIPNSVDTAMELNSYEAARRWYIENCVAESSKDKVQKESAIENVLDKISNGQSFYVEYSRFNDGNINFNQLCYDKILKPDSDEIEYLVLGFRNIDVAKKAEFDDLTGLLSRHVFFSKSEALLKANPDKQYDVVISDIIDFKKINETYGSHIADEILKWQGSFLAQLMSDELLVGRYGGDQMVLLGTREAIMKCISAQNRDAFYAAEAKNGLPPIVVKFGVYLDVAHDSPVITSCDKAHMALNSIKHQYKKDLAYYNDEIRNRLVRQRRIEDSMYESLENGDFKVYYQPKHNAKTGKLVGAEALIRWIHPEYGFMSPADFIPLFEKNGFIVEIDHYVWLRTCINQKKWAEKGIKTVPISVNGSKLTMADDELVKIMKESIIENGISPDMLHLEITETLMTENVSDLVERLNSIRNLGVKIELDDFGSGYSSLNVLSALPIDVVKLDMSFMQQFGDEKRTKVLVAVINLAKELGFGTVSEGVELKEQNELLGELGVDMIQGYYYSKPLPEDEFEFYMMEHSAEG